MVGYRSLSMRLFLLTTVAIAMAALIGCDGHAEPNVPATLTPEQEREILETRGCSPSFPSSSDFQAPLGNPYPRSSASQRNPRLAIVRAGQSWMTWEFAPLGSSHSNCELFAAGKRGSFRLWFPRTSGSHRLPGRNLRAINSKQITGNYINN